MYKYKTREKIKNEIEDRKKRPTVSEYPAAHAGFFHHRPFDDEGSLSSPGPGKFTSALFALHLCVYGIPFFSDKTKKSPTKRAKKSTALIIPCYALSLLWWQS